MTDSFSPTPQTGTKSYFLTFTAAPIDLQISSQLTLPPGTVSQPYLDHQLAATGGTGTLTWSLAGTSPNPLLPGLSLTPGGLLSGIPSSPIRTNYTMKFRVQDSAIPADFDEETFTITTSTPAAPVITTTSSSLIPNGRFNTPYTRTLQASGVQPFVWSFTGGSPFPNWLNLNPLTGVISGTPNATGTFNFNVQVTDNLGQSNPLPNPLLTITIDAQAAPVITPFPLQNGTVNQAYPPVQLQATGGITPYINWTVTPALPHGLQFNVIGPGIISGTPLISSPKTDYFFTVTDSTLPLGQTSIPIVRSLTINAAVTINDPSPLLIIGTAGQTYTAGSPLTTLTASGGTGSGYHNWLVTPALPTNLVLDNTTGAITGMATTAAPAANYTFSVQDSSNNPGTKQLSLAVNAALTINDPSPLPIIGTAGQTYTAGSPMTTLTASGGTGGYHNWLVTPTLPTGLALDNTTGAITGMATTAAPAANYLFSVQDSSNQTVSRLLSLAIN
ncbi:MAG: putative Ig domain-containing protein [Burkholderiaceae bacterium]|nr:putative Ig domain-containing protein [Burkholderiaceae bacterium]